MDIIWTRIQSYLVYDSYWYERYKEGHSETKQSGDQGLKEEGEESYSNESALQAGL